MTIPRLTARKRDVNRLSIIIPTCNDVTRLEDTLACVLAHRPSECQIIVPHDGGYTDPYDLQDEVEFLELSPSATRSEQIAAAVSEATGDVIHLLMPGCEVEEGWCEPALQHFDNPQITSVAPLLLADFDDQRTVSLGVGRGISGRPLSIGRRLRISGKRIAKLRPLGPTATAGFYRRDQLVEIGGWPAGMGTSLAALDAALSLQTVGGCCVVEPAARIAMNSAADSENRPSSFDLARQRERLYWRHRCGLLSTCLHPLVALGECLSAGGPLRISAALLGKVASLLDIPAARKHACKLRRSESAPVILKMPTTPAHTDDIDSRRAA